MDLKGFEDSSISIERNTMHVFTAIIHKMFLMCMLRHHELIRSRKTNRKENSNTTIRAEK